MAEVGMQKRGGTREGPEGRLGALGQRGQREVRTWGFQGSYRDGSYTRRFPTLHPHINFSPAHHQLSRAGR